MSWQTTSLDGETDPANTTEVVPNNRAPRSQVHKPVPASTRGRIAFTEEDDHTLLDWVNRAEREGVSTAGLGIFKDLEQVVGLSRSFRGSWLIFYQNDRHTSQSWQARWRKVRGDTNPGFAQSDQGSNVISGPEASVVINDVLTSMAVISREEPLSVIPEPRVFKVDEYVPDIKLTAADLPLHRVGTEYGIRSLLRLKSRGELATWLQQPWVVGVYTELARNCFDMRGRSGQRDQRRRGIRGAAMASIVNAALDAIENNTLRFVQSSSDTTFWTEDDHAIRFIVRLVNAGRAPGRWWDSLTEKQSNRELCLFGWNLLCWFRSVNKPHDGQAATQLQRANNYMWLQVLDRARRGSSGQASQLVYDAGGNQRWPSSQTQEENDLVLVGTEASDPLELDTALGTSLSIEGPFRLERSSSIVIGVTTSYQKDETAPPAHAVAAKQHMEVDLTPTSLSLPAILSYDMAVSGAKVSGSRISYWLSEDARDIFRHRQAGLLTLWGLTGTHKSTCLLIPQAWAYADPSQLYKDIQLSSFPPTSAHRLKFLLAGHSPSWVRAQTWFATERRGIDLDNFMGQGPFEPMEGSHLCHHGHCVNPNHTIYEKRTTNSDRSRCVMIAWSLRKTAHDVPMHCPIHEPPCLLQVSGSVQCMP